MSDFSSQPGAAPIPDRLVADLLPIAVPGVNRRQVSVRSLDSHSNDVAEVRVPDGRVLMVKRGRYDWSAERLDASRAAAELLADARAVVPVPLALPDDVDSRPVEAYWRIPHPTLLEVWPRLSETAQRRALRSLGALLRRVHAVRAPRHGPLGGPELDGPSAAGYLKTDLGGRLFPAIQAVWPDAAAPVSRLVDALPRLGARLGDAAPVLLHGDVHLGNVLCERRGGAVRCVGLLDLETAAGGPPESDLALAQVHHGPLFNTPLPGGWFAVLRRGYRRRPDPFVLAFYRCLHLANFGYYSALIGHDVHAASVAAGLRAEVDALSRAA